MIHLKTINCFNAFGWKHTTCFLPLNKQTTESFDVAILLINTSKTVYKSNHSKINRIKNRVFLRERYNLKMSAEWHTFSFDQLLLFAYKYYIVLKISYFLAHLAEKTTRRKDTYLYNISFPGIYVTFFLKCRTLNCLHFLLASSK